MSRIWAILCVLILCVAVVGCDPERVVVWSPSGKVGAVVGKEGGLYLSDGEGKITGDLVKEGRLACWEKEGTLLVVTSRGVDRWEELKKVLSTEEVAATEAGAKRVKRMVMEGKLSLKDSFEDPDVSAVMKDVGMFRIPGIAGVLMEDKEFMAVYGEEIRKSRGEEKLPYWSVERYTVKGTDGLKRETVLLSTLAEVKEVVPHLGGAMLVVTREQNDIDHAISLRRADGTVVRLSNRAAKYPGWSADGRWAYFMEANQEGEGMRLGGIVRVDTGAEDPSKAREELLRVIYDRLGKVREVAGGSVVFSGVRAAFPAGGNEGEERQQLMVIRPEKPAEVGSIVRPEDEDLVPEGGGLTGLFEVSGDGKEVIWPGKEGEVFKVDVETGAVKVIAAARAGAQTACIPGWKGKEICYSRPLRDDSEQLAFFVWDGAGSREISKKWPEAVLKTKVDKKQQPFP